MTGKQRHEGGHRAIADASETAVGWRRLRVMFSRHGLVIVFTWHSLSLGVPGVTAMHRTRCVVVGPQRALRRSGRGVAARFRRPMSGTAVARHERDQPRDLEHEPDRGEDAQPRAQGRHGLVRLPDRTTS
jgi:hypothetical protein